MKAETSETPQTPRIPDSPGVWTSAPWASTGQRLPTWLLDRLFVAIVMYVVIIALTFFVVLASPELVDSGTEVTTSIVALAEGLLSFFLCYSVLESTRGKRSAR